MPTSSTKPCRFVGRDTTSLPCSAAADYGYEVVTPARAQISADQFLSLPETNQRLELVDGEVIMAPSPSVWHQTTVGAIYVALLQWGATRDPAPTVLMAPVDVHMGPGRILQPDVLVFLDALPLDAQTPLERTPDLCVEVLSSNASYDRITKHRIYADAGVQEYWMVDRSGHFERYSGPGLTRLDTLDATLTSALLPGLRLDIPSLLP